MKKLITLVLALTMALSLVACGKSGGQTKKDVRMSEDGRQVITVGIQVRANVEDMYDNTLTKWLEEQSGYKLEFVTFSLSASEWRAQVNTMIASGEPLPDVMIGFGWNEDERYTYGSEGYLMDLKPYLLGDQCEGFRGRVANLFGEGFFEDSLRYIESPDGAIYAFPHFSYEASSDIPYHCYINRQWLDNLGLEKPTNWDELVAVLRAFKTRDPNGNGKSDEIPAIGLVPPSNTTTGSRANDMPSWLLNNFLYLDDSKIFNSENGKIVFPYTTDEYRQGLIALHDLVEEGLVSSLCWTMSTESKELEAMWNPVSGTPILGMVTASLKAKMATDNPLMYQYEGMIPFNYVPSDKRIPGTTTFITEYCDDIDAVLRLLNLMNTEDGSMLMSYGEEGVHWEWQEDDSLAGKGVKRLATFSGGSHKVNWSTSTTARLLLQEDPNTPYHLIPDPTQEWNNALTARTRKYVAEYHEAMKTRTPDEVVYKLLYNEAEMEAIGNTKTDILIYMKESRAKFANGLLDPRSDDDWNEYLRILDDMGLQNYIAQTQSAWDRFNGR